MQPCKGNYSKWQQSCGRLLRCRHLESPVWTTHVHFRPQMDEEEDRPQQQELDALRKENAGLREMLCIADINTEQ